MISRCPREIAASIDENIVVAERHVARGRWTTAELPFTIVCRRRVQRGVQDYDTTVADLKQREERKRRRRKPTLKIYGTLRGDFRRPSFQGILSSRLLFHEIFSPPQRDENIHFSLERKKKIFVFKYWTEKRAVTRNTGKVDFCLYEHSRPRALRLRCNLHAQGEPDVFQRHRPTPGVLPK